MAGFHAFVALCALLGADVARAHHLGEAEGFEKTLADADRAYDKRDFATALAGFRVALAQAKRVDNQVYARFRAALALRRLGQPAPAREALFTMARMYPRHDKTPRALYVAAQIREDDLRDKPGAESEQLTLLRRYPKSDQASRALFKVATLRKARSFDDAIEFLRETYRRHRSGPLGPRALYLGAQLFHEDKRSTDAIRLYELLAQRYPKSGFRDDALWHAAELHREGKRFERSLTLLRRIRRTMRESWAFGSYNSIHLDKAALLIAKIQLVDLRDLRAAADTLRAFIADFPHTFLRAEARGLYVDTLWRLGREGDARSAFSELERLFPKSRFTRAARALLQAQPPAAANR